MIATEFYRTIQFKLKLALQLFDLFVILYPFPIIVQNVRLIYFMNFSLTAVNINGKVLFRLVAFHKQFSSRNYFF